MKLINIAAALLFATAIGSAGLAAQDQQTQTKTKITVEDGKDVTVVGCVANAVGGTGYMLTNGATKKGPMHDYMLVTDENLSKHVGQRVEIKGKVTDRGDGKVKVETKTKVKVEDGPDQESKGKATLEGDGVSPFLGVKSMKVLAAVCR